MRTRIEEFRRRLLDLQNRATSNYATDDMDGVRCRLDEMCNMMDELASCVEEVEERLSEAIRRARGIED